MRISSILLLSALCIGQSHALNVSSGLLHAYECANCEQLSHQDFSMHSPAGNYVIKPAVKKQQKSKKYFIKTTLKQLQQGVAINTLAPEAVIRIIPQTNDKTFAAQFNLRSATQGTMPLKTASSLYAQDEAAALANPLLDKPSTVLQLRKDLGFGQFVIQTESAVRGHENDPYVIQIFDKFSSVYLKVGTDKTLYHYGDKLTATISLGDDAIGYPIDVVSAKLIAPDGTTTAMEIETADKNIYIATSQLSFEKGYAGENWYIEAQAETNVGNDVVKRYAHSAFSYAISSAEIRELKSIKAVQPFNFTARIEVATGSRYVLQAVLSATKDGKTVPVELTQSASWLSPGEQHINFSFSPEIAANYSPPYYLNGVKLLDYGQMKPVFELNKPINLVQLK